MKVNYKRSITFILNIIAALLSSSVAFIFIFLGLKFKRTEFISLHFTAISSTAVSMLFTLSILCCVFYLLDKKSIFRFIIFILICIDIVSIIFYFICANGLINKLTDINALRNYIRKAGSMAVAIFTVLQFLQVVVLPVPGSISVAAGVALFGPFWCTVYSFIGIIAGSILAFLIGRFIGVRAVRWMVGKDKLEKWLSKIKNKDYLILTAMFVLPLFPDDILCFIAGLSSMDWKYFLFVITVTRAASIAATAFSFGFIPLNTWWGITIWCVIILFAVGLFWVVLKYSDKISNFINKKRLLKH